MALSVLRQECQHLTGGQAGRYCYRGIAAFTTTSQTGTITTSLSKITHCSLTIIGTPASDEILSFSEDGHVGADGYLTVTSGVVTVVRTGAVATSGLKFTFELIGW